MNKLTKIGVSALCGSLAAVSAAHAGSMSVSGGATATYLMNNKSVTGNPLGMASNLTFTGTGELDNGATVTLNITNADKSTFSTAGITYAADGIGTISIDPGGGTGIDRYDDMMPTAWEEVDGAGLGMGLQTVSGAGGSFDIEWAVDEGFLPEGMKAYLSWNPHPDGSFNNDKAQSGATDNGTVDGFGYDVAVEHTGLYDGLKVFAGYSDIDQVANAGDRVQKVLGATLSMGSFTLGYQWSKDNHPGLQATATAEYYENNAYAISFLVNDNLSVSYGVHESEQFNFAENTTLKGESLQIAYSMGGATLKLAESEVDNASYGTGTASDKEGTTLVLSLAF